MKATSRKWLLAATAAAAALAFAAQTAAAQVIGLGTAQQGATVHYGTAIAKVVSERSGLQMRPQGLPSTGQYAPRVDAGELEFGLSNVIEATFSHQGKDMFEGRPTPNLRMAINLFPLPIVFLVPEKSQFNAPDRLGGARAPVGWNAQKLGDNIFRGFFANLDKSYDSVRGVPVSAMPRMWDLFGQGNLDLIFGILNGTTTRELGVKVGGARYLSVDDSPAAVQRMQKYLPGSYVTAEKNLDNGEIVKTIAFDFVLFTSTKVSDDIVYKVVKSVYEAQDELRSYNKEFRPTFVKAGPIDYHPGAIKFYKEVGLWPPKQ
ncbi:MAG TPA: TAXI family TRAP transporter solute-binding subunit [Burkholderiaceae bacterium]|jgi:uncharacterized protein|nr:TAXI family TRAP transporter solute-binding subunit [Burkholderiaceae bacterium]